MQKIYKHSNFNANMFGHGGNKRTAQINQLLLKSHLAFTEVDFSAYDSSPNKITSLLKGITKIKNPGIGLKVNYAAGRYIKQFENFVSMFNPDLFIWESTTEYYLLLSQVLQKNAIPFIAIPHNIESLVKGSKSVFSGKIAPHWLSEELIALQGAKQVFTMSREESWLLSLYGIEASYLPYYPPEELKNHLLNIRDIKTCTAKKTESKLDVLLLGTFYNSPTYNGYIEIINKLSAYKHINIHIAGFGSENLKSAFNNKNIQIWGSVSSQKLSELIVLCDCAIIHQEPTTGALTRIPELLLAGLPILANEHAARSYYHSEGLQLYHDGSELLDMLNTFDMKTPTILDRPVEEQHFINFLCKA